jgi:hypothetical protein
MHIRAPENRWAGLGLTALAAAAAYQLVIRPWHLRWGATDAEVRRPLPGDERVPNPVLQSTRAITIEAPPEAIWPWLAQMGWRRGGWYTYAFLDVFDLRARGEPMFSGRLTDRIIPELQQPRVGDLLDPSGFRVAEVDPPRALVLEVRGGVPGIAWMAGDSTWVFALQPLDSHRTRLLERWRIAFPIGPLTLFFWGLVEAVDFVMQRAQLRHIKERVERAETSASAATTSHIATAIPAP